MFLSTELDFEKRHGEGMLILHGWLKLRNQRITTSVVNGPQTTQRGSHKVSKGWVALAFMMLGWVDDTCMPRYSILFRASCLGLFFFILSVYCLGFSHMDFSLVVLSYFSLYLLRAQISVQIPNPMVSGSYFFFFLLLFRFSFFPWLCFYHLALSRTRGLFFIWYFFLPVTVYIYSNFWIVMVSKWYFPTCNCSNLCFWLLYVTLFFWMCFTSSKYGICPLLVVLPMNLFYISCRFILFKSYINGYLFYWTKQDNTFGFLSLFTVLLDRTEVSTYFLQISILWFTI